jgi:zinc transport system permease protein
MLIIIIACILLSILFAPLGSSLVWQKRAYFSDGLAHACLLASSLSSCFDIPIIISAPSVATLFALLVVGVRGVLSSNAAINLVSSTMLALGLLLASVFPSSINISALLFGDILATTQYDLFTLSALVSLVCVMFLYKIDDLILFSMSPDLASVRGISVKRLELYFLILLALVLSVSMKIMGALLVTALLMIPSYSAVLLSKTPMQMIFYSFIVAVTSCLCGVAISFYCDFAAAPSIILSCSLIYFIILFYRKILLHCTNS